MRRIILAAAIAFVPAIASAQIIEEVHTKNGSVYSGFISEQQPGTHMSVYAENALIVFDKADVQNSRKDYYDFNLLPELSKELLRDICDTTSLYLTSFDYKGTHYENLYIKETKETTYSTYSLIPRTYFLPWNEVVKTAKVSLKDNPYGIREVVTLKNGERYVGSILEQEISKGIVFEDQNGTRYTFSSNDVLSVLVEKISDKHNLWEQTPLLDRLITSDGTMLEGLITSRIMGQHVNLLMKYSDEPQQILAKNIKKYQKTRNKAFNKYVVDTTKVMRLNDIDATLITLEQDEDVYVRQDVNVNTFNVGTALHLVTKNIPHGKTVAIYEFQVMKKGREKSFVIPVDALPIYETTLTAKDDHEVCDLIIRKPGKYYVAIDGFKTGLNVVFEPLKEE